MKLGDIQPFTPILSHGVNLIQLVIESYKLKKPVPLITTENGLEYYNEYGAALARMYHEFDDGEIPVVLDVHKGK